MAESTQLMIALSVEDGDRVELDELTHQLQSQIEQLSIDSVGNVSEEETLEGTKAADWISIGNLAVTLAPTVVPPLFELLKSWVERKPATPVKVRVRVGKNRTAQIEYDPTTTTTEDLEKLVRTLGKTVD